VTSGSNDVAMADTGSTDTNDPDVTHSVFGMWPVTMQSVTSEGLET